MDLGGLLELIDKKLPGWMTRSLLAVLWFAAMGAGFHYIYIYWAAPVLRFLATHDFASIIHLSAKIWMDILVMLAVLALIFSASVCAAFLVIWFFLAYFVAPIFKAFQRKPKEEEDATTGEQPAPLDILSDFPALKKLDEA